MSGAIEDLAKKWISEPKYQKVFKHTADVVEDYFCYLLVALGAVALSVRFLSSMGTGEAICVVTGLREENGTSYENLGPYPSGGTISIVNYANFNQECVNTAMTGFMQYIPFILLLQAVAVIIVEKMMMSFPRVSQKIERFYGVIVEESLFGKDPDVAEDVQDLKANTEAISRVRRRREVCMGLKRSSVIFHTYILKNIIVLLLLLMFIAINISFGIEAQSTNLSPGTCVLHLGEIPQLGLRSGEVYLQCEGKKIQFFLNLLFVQISVLVLIFICSCISIIWALLFRNISVLLQKIEKYHVDWDVETETTSGRDFLFLFDMLAHTSGIESTLRVLTHADETFRRICLPKLRNDTTHIRVEEDKVKVIWSPASLENWLQHNSHKGIEVDSYDVTIYPAESVNNSVTKTQADKEDGVYSAWFCDLQGGKTEYVITIATVIGKSRMKGERIVTTLLPYGPERPRAGIVKSVQTDEIEISWEPPKGGFTKYVMCVDPNVNTTNYQVTNTIRLQNGIMNPNFFYVNNDFQASAEMLTTINKDYTERDLSSLITEYKITGLYPGEIYGIELKTKTGSRLTRKPILETIMTKPEKVSSFSVSKISTTAALVSWVAPEGHKKLRAFNMMILSHDQKLRRELAVKHNTETAINSFLVSNLFPATTYTVNITSVCVFEILETLSEVETTRFSTRPEPPTCLSLESRSPASLTVRWEPPGGQPVSGQHKYKLSIESPAISYSADYTVGGDRNTFNFSKLPEISGSGQTYEVKVENLVTPAGDDQEVSSVPLTGRFTTKPLAPSNFKTGPGAQEISWSKSPTPNVSSYRVRYKSVEEGSKAEERLVPAPADPEALTCSTDLPDVWADHQYKVNIYALVQESPDTTVESKELHEKILLTDGSFCVYSEELDRLSLSSRGSNN